MLRQLANKLGVSPHKIKKHNLRYYYTKHPQLCCRYQLDPIDPTVGPYEFGKAIKILADYYKEIKSDYYRNLLKETTKYGSDILDHKPNKTLDHMMMEYVKFRPSTFVITLWPNAVKMGQFDKLQDLLQNHGTIYYIRKFKLSYNAARNLIYQIYSDVYRLSTVDKIDEKLEYVGWKRDEVAHFKIVIFDHQSNMTLSGSQAPLKEEIRRIWLEGTEGSFRGDDFVHINDHFYQTVEYCKLFLNRNSLIAIHHQNLNKHLDRQLENCRIYINTIKSWIIRNVSPIDMDRFLLMSSTVLYTHGIRSCRDVDGVLSEYPKESKTSNLYQKVLGAFYNRKTKFFFAEINVPGTYSWKESWEEKNKIWFGRVGAGHMDDLIFNPEYHYFYNGLKFTILKVDIHKRLLRRRFSDYGDLLEIERMTHIKVDLPHIPERYTKEEFIKLVKEYMAKRYPDHKDYMDRIEGLKVED